MVFEHVINEFFPPFQQLRYPQSEYAAGIIFRVSHAEPERLIAAQYPREPLWQLALLPRGASPLPTVVFPRDYNCRHDR